MLPTRRPSLFSVSVSKMPFVGRDHAELPVFADHGDPIAGEIDGSIAPRSRRGSASSASGGRRRTWCRRCPAATSALRIAWSRPGARGPRRERTAVDREIYSTISPALVPQLNPSAGRVRLTISNLYSPGTREGRPTIVISSLIFRVS